MASGKTFVVRRGMTAVPNATIYGTFQALAGEDGEARPLSIQALGLLLLLLSRPTGRASMGYRAFQGRGVGRDVLLRSLRELDQAGLRYQFRRRSPDKGGIITDTVVAETPITQEEAEAEWLAMLGTPKAPARPTKTPKSDSAPEIGAPGEETAPVVRRISVALETGASSVPDAKVSYKAPPKETGIDQKSETPTPASTPDAEPLDDDAATGDGRAQVRAMLEARRLTREQDARERRADRDALAARLRGTESRTGSAGAFERGGSTPMAPRPTTAGVRA